MARTHRPRRLAAGVLAAAALILLGCTGSGYPNTTFNHTTEVNTAIDGLWDRMLFLGTLVFIGVEAALVYVIVKFRRREGQTEPRHVHGNTTLEILWTAIPAVILVFIAIPTVRTIFNTQAKARAGALQVEVIGHQWWWEFRYPEFTTMNPVTKRLDTLTTANELYLPIGRTVNFALKTADVLHSFWIPRLGGKRDLIANHTNFLWYTPVDSMSGVALNGSCNEYCGASHANMKFRAFTVTPAEFDQWARGQLQTASFNVAPTPPAAPAAAPANAVATTSAATSATTPAVTRDSALRAARALGDTTPAALMTAGTPWTFPKEKLPPEFAPTTPVPRDIAWNDALVGDATRGQQAFLAGGCIGCHVVAGNPLAQGKIGPNLTHIGSRYTIAGAQFPNETAYLVRWIKNAKKMKPGSLMPTIGKGEIDPVTGQAMKFGLTDQQVADVVAYLQALK